ncbi:hypothetical protein BUALT_Bualt02G0159800 [Buddleja alternifolia]|uniref:DUF4378 domain-containing protein n=1 Tax=Buddleja alternifolia TaxID=168488 RepID=A0AAV6YBN7_9LAMI|nr:hypothetical protein BUALT_Bualt02G0159800 [Buddleja alternifolia]
MAAKLLHSLTDENHHHDLQKQIGCMTGIFQMFDRQHILTASGGRRIVKRLPPPPGNSHFSGDTLERESNNAPPMEKYSHKTTQDKRRVSNESSRASFSSSSRSSSFSSLDCNRATQLEPASFDRMIFPETPSRDPSMTPQSSSSTQFNRQSLDLRDLVKDSMYREVQGLSVKAKTVEEAKYRDSPRLQSKISDGKFQEVPRYNNEPRQLLRSSSYNSKEGSSFSISKVAPRFSYDGREINRTSFDDSKSSLKLKDLPRLSLDSREGSMRNLNTDSKFVKSMQQIHGNQARPPSVVAKLMGLETLPDSNVGSSRSYQDEDFVNISSSFEKTDAKRPIQVPSSLKNSCKEPSSPRFSSVKPMSKFPIEPAPWKQIDGMRGSQKLASRSTRSPAKGTTPTSFPSVYSEIEKRLKDLEFMQSGKDLRALKQILEAMQAKGLLETQKEGQGSNFTSQRDHEQIFMSSSRSIDNRKPQTNQVVAFSKRRAGSNYESPIVIMKPAKLVEKSGIPAASVISLDGFSGLPKLRDSEFVDNRKSLSSGRAAKDPTVNSVNMKNERTLKTTQTSTKSQQLARDANAGPMKSPASISPRMQQKKLDMEKRSRPPTPPDSSKSKRQPNKQQAESNSPGGRRRPKHTSLQQSNDQLSEISVESNENTQRGSEIAEVTSSERSPGKASEFMMSGLVEKKSTVSEEGSAESGFIPSEYSSPVSVLDNVVSKNESLSPIKYVGKTLKVNVSLDKEKSSNAANVISVDSFASNSTESVAAFEMNRKKLQNIDNLVEKLRRLNSSHDEARTDYIASLCENTDPDNRYVSEILLASGLLLRDLTDFQFHKSGHPINPELFLVLEQTKASTSPKPELSTTQSIIREKFHRKLIFDSVNEILARKLCSPVQHSNPWLKPVKLARKTLNTQKLLRELCLEIEGLQANNPKCSSDEEDERWKNILCEDVMRQSESWINFDGEISGAVLDIERSIFKDLVNEVVNGESADGLKTKPGKRRLFVAS